MANLEFHEQVKFINWCITYQYDEHLPDLDLIFAIPNGANLKKDKNGHSSEGGKLVKEGLRKGVPDLFLPVPQTRYHGLWIEMKAPEVRHHNTNKIIKRKGTSTKEQKKWHERLSALSYKVVVAYGRDEAVSAVLEYYGIEDRKFK